MNGKDTEPGIKCEDVQEVLAYLEPLIRGREGTVHAEPLLHILQETDGSWGHCRFMEVLKNRLRKEMGSLVREEIGRAVEQEELTAASMQTIAPRALKRLMQSPEWQSLVNKTKTEVRRESKEAAKHIRQDGKASSMSRHGNGDSLGSTWTQSNFMFLQDEQIKQVVSQLDGAEGEEGRVRALDTLLLTQILDIIGGEHWIPLKAGLRKTLAVSDPKVFVPALKIHARMLNSSSQFAVKESYNNLIETVVGWYKHRKIASLLPTSSLQQDAPLHTNLVSVLALVCGVCRELPKVWVRYPPRYVQEMVDNMITLLSLRAERTMPPCHIISVLDPNIIWLTEWFHSFLSRSCLLANLSRNPGYLSTMVQNLQDKMENTEVSRWLAPAENIQRTKGETSLNIAGETIEYAAFVFHLKLICKVLSYKQGRALLPQVSPLISSMSSFLFLNGVSAETGRIVAASLKPLLSSCYHLFSPDVDLMIDRLSKVELSPAAMCNILNCIPVTHLDSRLDQNLVENFLQNLDETVENEELYRITLTVTMSLLYRCPFRMDPAFKRLLWYVYRKAEV